MLDAGVFLRLADEVEAAFVVTAQDCHLVHGEPVVLGRLVTDQADAGSTSVPAPSMQLSRNPSTR